MRVALQLELKGLSRSDDTASAARFLPPLLTGCWSSLGLRDYERFSVSDLGNDGTVRKWKLLYGWGFQYYPLRSQSMNNSYLGP